MSGSTALDQPARAAGDVRLAAASLDELEHGVAVVAAVPHHAGSRQAGQQVGHGGLVRGLAGREQQPDRQSLVVHYGVDLGAQSATRTANGVIRAPFFPPAACWCARMIELSISCSDCGERADSVSKMRSHTPAFAQRL